MISTITSITAAQFTYYAALAATPVAAWENDSLLKSVASIGAVETNAGSWYYDGTNLYLHASDGSNVATNGKAYTYFTASSPSYTMWDNGKNYLVINGIDQAETYNTSTATLGGLYLTGSNSIVENLAVHDVYRHGFCFYLTRRTTRRRTSRLTTPTAPRPFAFTARERPATCCRNRRSTRTRTTRPRT